MKYLSIFNSDNDIICAIDDIHLKGKWIDLDCTYSKGNFYKDKQPRIMSDLVPQNNQVIESDSRDLGFIENDSLYSVIFDPPFLFRNRASKNKDKISKRFSYFNSYDELIDMYKKSMDCIYRKLKRGGYLLFKCQHITDGKFYCTHVDIINYAIKIGYVLKDIGIKTAHNKLQKDAKQQNCFAKTHCYWLIFKKK